MSLNESLRRVTQTSSEGYFDNIESTPEKDLWIAVLKGAIHDLYFPRSGLPNLPTKKVYAQDRSNLVRRIHRKFLRPPTPEECLAAEQKLRAKIKRYKAKDLQRIRSEAHGWLTGGCSDDVGSLPWVCESLWPGQGLQMAEKISKEIIHGRVNGADIRYLLDNKKQGRYGHDGRIK